MSSDNCFFLISNPDVFGFVSSNPVEIKAGGDLPSAMMLDCGAQKAFHIDAPIVQHEGTVSGQFVIYGIKKTKLDAIIFKDQELPLIFSSTTQIVETSTPLRLKRNSHKILFSPTPIASDAQGVITQSVTFDAKFLDGTINHFALTALVHVFGPIESVTSDFIINPLGHTLNISFPGGIPPFEYFVAEGLYQYESEKRSLVLHDNDYIFSNRTSVRIFDADNNILDRSFIDYLINYFRFDSARGIESFYLPGEVIPYPLSFQTTDTGLIVNHYGDGFLFKSLPSDFNSSAFLPENYFSDTGVRDTSSSTRAKVAWALDSYLSDITIPNAPKNADLLAAEQIMLTFMQQNTVLTGRFSRRNRKDYISIFAQYSIIRKYLLPPFTNDISRVRLSIFDRYLSSIATAFQAIESDKLGVLVAKQNLQYLSAHNPFVEIKKHFDFAVQNDATYYYEYSARLPLEDYYLYGLVPLVVPHPSLVVIHTTIDIAANWLNQLTVRLQTEDYVYRTTTAKLLNDIELQKQTIETLRSMLEEVILSSIPTFQSDYNAKKQAYATLVDLWKPQQRALALQGLGQRIARIASFESMLHAENLETNTASGIANIGFVVPSDAISQTVDFSKNLFFAVNKSYLAGSYVSASFQHSDSTEICTIEPRLSDDFWVFHTNRQFTVQGTVITKISGNLQQSRNELKYLFMCSDVLAAVAPSNRFFDAPQTLTEHISADIITNAYNLLDFIEFTDSGVRLFRKPHITSLFVNHTKPGVVRLPITRCIIDSVTMPDFIFANRPYPIFVSLRMNNMGDNMELALTVSTYDVGAQHPKSRNSMMLSDFSGSSDTQLRVTIPSAPEKTVMLRVGIRLGDTTNSLRNSYVESSINCAMATISDFRYNTFSFARIGASIFISFRIDKKVKALLTFNQTVLESTLQQNASDSYVHTFNLAVPSASSDYPFSIQISHTLYSDVFTTLSGTTTVQEFFEKFTCSIPNEFDMSAATLPGAFHIERLLQTGIGSSDIQISAVINMFVDSDASDNIQPTTSQVNSDFVQSIALNLSDAQKDNVFSLPLHNLDLSHSKWIVTVGLYTIFSEEPFAEYSKKVSLRSPGIVLETNAVSINQPLFILTQKQDTASLQNIQFSLSPRTNLLQAVSGNLTAQQQEFAWPISDSIKSDLLTLGSFTVDLYQISLSNQKIPTGSKTIRVLQTMFTASAVAPAYIHETIQMPYFLQITNGSGHAKIMATVDGRATTQIVSDLTVHSAQSITITAPSTPGTYTVQLTAQDLQYDSYIAKQTVSLQVFSVTLSDVHTVPQNLYVNKPFDLVFSAAGQPSIPSDLSLHVVLAGDERFSDMIVGPNHIPLIAPANAGTSTVYVFAKRPNRSDVLIKQVDSTVATFHASGAGSHRNVPTGKPIKLGVDTLRQTEVMYEWSADPYADTNTISDCFAYPTMVKPVKPTTYTIVTKSTYYSDLIASDAVSIYAEPYDFSDVTVAPSSSLVPGCYIHIDWFITSKPTDAHTTVITMGSRSDITTHSGPQGSYLFKTPTIENSDLVLTLRSTSARSGIETETSLPLHMLDVSPFTDVPITQIRSDIAFIAPYRIGTVCVWSVKTANLERSPFSDTSISDANRPIAPRDFSVSSLFALEQFLNDCGISSVVLLANTLSTLSAFSQQNISIKAIDDAVWYLRRKGFCVNADMYFFVRLFETNTITPVALNQFPNLLQLYNNQFFLSDFAIAPSTLPLNNCSPQPCGIEFSIDTMPSNIAFVGYDFQIPITVTSLGASGAFGATVNLGESDYAFTFSTHQTTLSINPLSIPVSDYVMSIHLFDTYSSDCSDQTQSMTIRARTIINHWGPSDVNRGLPGNFLSNTLFHDLSLVVLYPLTLYIPTPELEINRSLDALNKYTLLVCPGFPDLSPDYTQMAFDPSSLPLDRSAIAKSLIIALAKNLRQQNKYLLIDETVVHQMLSWNGIYRDTSLMSPPEEYMSTNFDLRSLRTDPETRLSIVYMPSESTNPLEAEGITFIAVQMKDYILQDFGHLEDTYCFINDEALVLPLKTKTLETIGACTLDVDFNGAEFQLTGYNSSDFDITLPKPNLPGDYPLVITVEDASLLVDRVDFTVATRELIDFSSINIQNLNLGIAFMAMEEYNNSVPYGAFGLRIKMADSDISFGADLFASAMTSNGYNSDLASNNFGVFSDVVSQIADVFIDKGIQYAILTSWSKQRIICDGSDTQLKNHIWIYEQLIARLKAHKICVCFDLSFFAHINAPLNKQMTYTAITGIDALSSHGIYFPCLSDMNRRRRFIPSEHVTLNDLKGLTGCSDVSDNCSVDLVLLHSDISVYPGDTFTLDWTVDTHFGQDRSKTTLDFAGQVYTSDYQGVHGTYALTAPQSFSNVHIMISDSTTVLINFDANFSVTPVKIIITQGGSDYQFTTKAGRAQQVSIPFNGSDHNYVLQAVDLQSNTVLATKTGDIRPILLTLAPSNQHIQSPTIINSYGLLTTLSDKTTFIAPCANEASLVFYTQQQNVPFSPNHLVKIPFSSVNQTGGIKSVALISVGTARVLVTTNYYLQSGYLLGRFSLFVFNGWSDAKPLFSYKSLNYRPYNTPDDYGAPYISPYPSLMGALISAPINDVDTLILQSRDSSSSQDRIDFCQIDSNYNLITKWTISNLDSASGLVFARIASIDVLGVGFLNRSSDAIRFFTLVNDSWSDLSWDIVTPRTDSRDLQYATIGDKDLLIVSQQTARKIQFYERLANSWSLVSELSVDFNIVSTQHTRIGSDDYLIATADDATIRVFSSPQVLAPSIKISARNALFTDASDVKMIPFSYHYPAIHFSDVRVPQHAEIGAIIDVTFDFVEKPLLDSYRISIGLSDLTNEQIITTSDPWKISIPTPSVPGVYPVTLNVEGKTKTLVPDTASSSVIIDDVKLSNLRFEPAFADNPFPVRFDLFRSSNFPTPITLHWDDVTLGLSDLTSDYMPGSDLVILGRMPQANSNQPFSLRIGANNRFVQNRSLSGLAKIIAFETKNEKFVQLGGGEIIADALFGQSLYTNRTDFQLYFDVHLENTVDTATATFTLGQFIISDAKTVIHGNNQSFDNLITPLVPSDYPYTITLTNGVYTTERTGIAHVSQIFLSDLITVYTTQDVSISVPFFAVINNGFLNNEQVTLSFMGSDIQQALQIGMNMISVPAPSTVGIYPYSINIRNNHCSTSKNGLIEVMAVVISDLHVPPIQIGSAAQVSFDATYLYGSGQLQVVLSLAGSDIIVSDITAGAYTFTIDASDVLTKTVDYPLSIRLVDSVYPFNSDVITTAIKVTRLVVTDISTIYVCADAKLSLPVNVVKENNTEDPAVTLILNYLDITAEFKHITIGGYSLNLAKAPPFGSYPFQLTVIDDSTNASDVKSGRLYAAQVALQNMEYGADVDIIIQSSLIDGSDIVTTKYNIGNNQGFDVHFDFDVFFGGYDVLATLDIMDQDKQKRFFRIQSDFQDRSDSTAHGILPAMAPATPGEYVCVLTLVDLRSGCSNAHELPLAVKSAAVNLGSDRQVALGQVLQLGDGIADPHMTYLWLPSDAVLNATGFPTTTNPILSDITYTLITARTDVFDCVASDSIAIVPVTPFEIKSFVINESVLLPGKPFEVVCFFSQFEPLSNLSATLFFDNHFYNGLALALSDTFSSDINIVFTGITASTVGSDQLASVTLSTPYYSHSSDMLLTIEPLIQIIPFDEKTDNTVKVQNISFYDSFFSFAYSAKNYDSTTHDAVVIFNDKKYTFHDLDNSFSQITLEVPRIIHDYDLALTIRTTTGTRKYEDTKHFKINIVPELMLHSRLKNKSSTNSTELISVRTNEIGLKNNNKNSVDFYRLNAQQEWTPSLPTFYFSDRRQASDLIPVHVLFEESIGNVSDVFILSTSDTIYFDHCVDNSDWKNLSDWRLKGFNNISSILFESISDKNVLVVTQFKKNTIKFYENQVGAADVWAELSDWNFFIPSDASPLSLIWTAIGEQNVLGVAYDSGRSDQTTSRIKFYKKDVMGWSDMDWDLGPTHGGKNLKSMVVNGLSVLFFTAADQKSTTFYERNNQQWLELSPAWSTFTNQPHAVGLQPIMIQDKEYIAVPDDRNNLVDFYDYLEPNVRHILRIDMRSSQSTVQAGSDLELFVTLTNEGLVHEIGKTIFVEVNCLNNANCPFVPQPTVREFFISDLAPGQTFSDTTSLSKMIAGKFLCTAYFLNENDNAIKTQTVVGASGQSSFGKISKKWSL